MLQADIRKCVRVTETTRQGYLKQFFCIIRIKTRKHKTG